MAALIALLAPGCARVDHVEIPDTVSELRSSLLARFSEQEASEAALALHNTPRWYLAAADAVLTFPEAANTFSCALGATITEQTAPNLYMLLWRSLPDLGFSTYAAKERYDRPRPFEVNGEPICTPEVGAALRTNGSYPSGPAAIGWGWALILTDLAPGRQ